MLDDTPNQDQSLMGFSEASLSRAPLTGATHRLQSKAFQIHIAVNPLIAAASVLLAFSTKLATLRRKPNLKKLHANLSHEVKAFENQAQQLGYRAQTVLAARYLLCSMLDECILGTRWGRDSEWQQHNLLTSFQRESWGGDRFFLILERSAEDPATYLDLLELGYLCLSLGFQGKYQTQAHMHELAMFIDNLYDVIRHQRGEISSKWLLCDQSAPKAKAKWRLPPLWFIAGLTCIALIGIFIPYSRHLNALTQQALHSIQSMTPSKPND